VTGHKTLSMLSRYVNPTARDVVKAFDATDGASSVAAAPRGLAGELPANEESFQPKARRRTK